MYIIYLKVIIHLLFELFEINPFNSFMDTMYLKFIYLIYLSLIYLNKSVLCTFPTRLYQYSRKSLCFKYRAADKYPSQTHKQLC